MQNMYDYNEVVRKMRFFFQEAKGFVEVPAQSRQSILAACEDPATISQYIFSGVNWPLPQTGQPQVIGMNLILLKVATTKYSLCLNLNHMVGWMK